MVLCCVPSCGSESQENSLYFSSITFHEFPSDPVLAEKWVKQISKIAGNPFKEPWASKGKAVVCSKHFLQTNFNDDSDTLKPSSIPTVFGHKYIGYSASDARSESTVSDLKKSPLIVKVIKPVENDTEISLDICKEVKSKECPKEKKRIPKMLGTATSNSSKVTKIYLPSPSKEVGKDFPLPKSHLSSKSILNSVLRSLIPDTTRAVPSSSRSGFLQKKGNSRSTIRSMPEIASSKTSPNRKRKKASPENNVIEIGPNTFLKINPEVIKVNKKQTPSGNTVLQFVMSQKLANSSGTHMLPKLIQSVTNSEAGSFIVQETAVPPKKQSATPTSDQVKKDPVVQHVVGHLVDTHVCKDSCEKLKEEDMSCDEMVLDDTETTVPNDMEIEESMNSHLDVPSIENKEATGKSSKSGSSVLNKAPVLFTTNVPLSHCMLDKPKYVNQLRQKSRQIASLKFKITSLTKKIEELENKCIVQERQLSYSFIKKLKAVRKAASAGDPCANFIVEQIRCYSGDTNSKTRWSDSTLAQCGVWCRKAPYAYEYFKKANFFKLPCLGTVKRFMKKHPELKLQGRANGGNPNNSSSSDFDFDDSDSGTETALTSASMVINPSMSQSVDTSVASTSVMIVAGTDDANKGKSGGINSFPVSMDSAKLEVQEILLASGEVVQCYTSSLCNGDLGNQYYIIPNVGDQTTSVNQEYNVVQSGETLPVILQNLDNAQQPLQQEQYVFISNSSDQVECSESEVITS